eukprot:COSAG01_NODE_2660_length_7299_cov_5.937639_6_plen_186_part_00
MDRLDHGSTATRTFVHTCCTCSSTVDPRSSGLRMEATSVPCHGSPSQRFSGPAPSCTLFLYSEFDQKPPTAAFFEILATWPAAGPHSSKGTGTRAHGHNKHRHRHTQEAAASCAPATAAVWHGMAPSTVNRPHPLNRSIQPLLLAGAPSFPTAVAKSALPKFPCCGFWLQKIGGLRVQEPMTVTQ